MGAFLCSWSYLGRSHTEPTSPTLVLHMATYPKTSTQLLLPTGIMLPLPHCVCPLTQGSEDPCCLPAAALDVAVPLDIVSMP